MKNIVNDKVKTLFFQDNGLIPNSKLPVLIYKLNLQNINDVAAFLEETFKSNHWGRYDSVNGNSWRGGVFDYWHYHSICHEVCGVYSGSAKIHFGGESGKIISVEKGHVILIPAGVGHKKISSTNNFAVVGAYPNGFTYDLLTGKAHERMQSQANIAKVPVPNTDPIYGNTGLGILAEWK